MTTGIHRPAHGGAAGGPGPALPPGDGDRAGPGRDTRRGADPAGVARGAAALPPAAGDTGRAAVSAASRVSVLAPRTRIDVALPPDVPLADLLPVLLDLAGESGGDGGTRHGGWALAPLGQGPADPQRTLASLGVLDGDQLVLRRRADAAPPPLFDDVVDAVAESTPISFRAWGPGPARRLGLAGLALGLAGAAAALVVAGRGPGTVGGLVTALLAGVLAIACVTLGAVCARVFAEPAAGAVLAAGGVGLAAVCGVAAVPAAGAGPLADTWTAPHLLLGAVLAVVAAAAALLVLGTAARGGLALLVALLAGAVLVALTTGVATVVGAGDPAALAAGAGAAALVASSLLPRTSIALARLPLPQVPGSAEELADDPGVAEHADIERRTDRAHAAMTGLVAGCGVVTAGAVAVLSAAPVTGVRGVCGWVLAVLLVVLLALRSRTYANGVQAVALLVCALVAAAALLVGVLTTTTSSLALLGVTALALAGGVVSLLLGVALPGRRSSPVARRAVDIAEAVGIAAVLPLALAVTDLYTAMRLL